MISGRPAYRSDATRRTTSRNGWCQERVSNGRFRLNPAIRRAAVYVRSGLIAANQGRTHRSAVGHLRKSETVPGESAPGGQGDVNRRKADILVDLDRQHQEEIEDKAGRFELLNLLRPIWPRTRQNKRFDPGCDNSSRCAAAGRTFLA